MSESSIDILVHCKQGDTNAFRLLVEEYQAYAFRLAFRLLCCEEDAKDVVQESFIRVWRHLPQYNLKSKFTTWLYRIVTNLCYDRIKARRRQGKIMQQNSDTLNSNTISCNYDLEKEMSNKELAQIILDIAEELSPKQKTVFVLRDLQDLSISEVAKITGLSKGTIKSNLYHARLHIREKCEQLNINYGLQDEM